MKEFCFGLFLGMTMGALLVANCEKAVKAVKIGQKKVVETIEKAKKELDEEESSSDAE